MQLSRRICALCFLVIPFTLAAPAAAADVEINEDARQHFRAGVSLMQDPDGARYEEAYAEFKAAYEAAPSWKILGNLGITSMKLERDGEAIVAFETYLKEGGDRIEASERAQFERDLETLKASVVTLTLQSTPPGAVFIDERIPNRGAPIINQYEGQSGPLTIGVRPGVHRIRAKLAGYAEQVWELKASSRSQQSHTFALERPALVAGASGSPASPLAADAKGAQGSGLRLASYASFGVGAVGLGLGSYLLFSAANTSGDADALYDECSGASPGGRCSDAEQREIVAKDDDATSQRTFGVTSLVVGGIGAAAGVTLFILSRKKDETPKQGSAPQLVPVVGLGSLGLAGTF